MDDFDSYADAAAPGLLRFAWLLTGNVHDEEDLAQSALVRLCLHWPRVSRSEDVDAYARRVLINASHSRFRRRRHEQVSLDAMADRGVLDAGISSVEDRAGPP